MAGLSTRAGRALAIVGIAIVGVLVVGFVHFYRAPVVPSGGHSTQPPRPPARSGLLLVTFGDADHGAVVTSDPNGGETYVTADGGRTWSQRHVGPSAVTFLDGTDAIVAVPVPTPSLYSTADAGRSWLRLRAPVHVMALGLHLSRVTGGPTFLDPANGWWLDASPRPSQTVLWHTADGGRTWTRLTGSGLPTGEELWQPVFVDRSRGAIVVGPATGSWPSLVTTQDGGDTWRPAALPAAPADSFGGGITVAAPQLLERQGRLVVSVALNTAAGGLAQWSSPSDDGGQTWLPWSREPPPPATFFAAPIVDDTGRLLMADSQRLWTSADEGRTWQTRPVRLPSGAQALATVAAVAGAVFVVAERQTPSRTPGVALLRSRDGGASWTEIRLPHPVSAVAN